MSAEASPDPLAQLPEDPGHRRHARALLGSATVVLALALWPWGWGIEVVDGSRPCWGPCTLDAGDLFTGAPGDVWRFEVGEVGTAMVSGGAVVGRLEVDEGYAFRLDAGHMEVVSTAGPRELVIETPAGRVVDLGCAFTVDVTDSATTVHVSRGYVALEAPRGTAVIGAGSSAVSRLGSPPEPPLRDDAPPPLAASFATTPGGDLPVVLGSARPADTFTLWHVLRRTPESDRDAVLDTIERLVPGAVPADRRPGLVKLQLGALQGLWEALAPAAYREAEGAG